MAVLQIIFGITSRNLSLWLRFRRRLLLKVLRADQRAIVSMPSEEEVNDFIEAINMKYPALPNCWGAMDGLKVRLEKAGNSQIQNIFFNGWTHDHYISILFLFSPDGKIRACYMNAPGTMHDSTIANWGALYEKVDDLYTSRGAKIVVDLAFALDWRQFIGCTRAISTTREM
jgi:hypothetical protein